MGKKIAIILLGIFLAVSLIFLVRSLSSIEQLEDTLSERTVRLEEIFTYLRQKEAQLAKTQAELNQTKAQWEESKLQLAQVEEELGQLMTQLEQTEADLGQAEFKLDKTEGELSALNVAHDQLETTAEENKFLFYYVSLKEEQYSISKLEASLSQWQWKKEAYKLHVFDCSEMSAALEWVLENDGFHTIIVTGDSPDGKEGKHAWLLVEVVSGQYMPVEATTSSIIYWANPYFNNYFKYDQEFETIHEALAYSHIEFDWWKF